VSDCAEILLLSFQHLTCKSHAFRPLSLTSQCELLLYWFAVYTALLINITACCYCLQGNPKDVIDNIGNTFDVYRSVRGRFRWVVNLLGCDDVLMDNFQNIVTFYWCMQDLDRRSTIRSSSSCIGHHKGIYTSMYLCNWKPWTLPEW
jgi:hypothetical protein